MSSGLPSHVEEADLISYGLLGLISAIRRFEPEREIKFETFAIMRIKGSIIDELRSLDWVPRSVRTKAREIERVNAQLENELLRAPTDQEMAAALDVTVEEFHESLVRISNSSVVALDELWTVSDASGARSRCSTRSTTRRRSTRPPRWTRRSCTIGWPTRSPACPSARSS
jgi:RNA polymerase sigma factor FliA